MTASCRVAWRRNSVDPRRPRTGDSIHRGTRQPAVWKASRAFSTASSSCFWLCGAVPRPSSNCGLTSAMASARSASRIASSWATASLSAR
jgi:hypothetical protein